MAFGNTVVESNAAGLVQNVNFAIFSKLNAQIIPLIGVVDLYYSENHNISVGTTQYPIESGATNTDHVFVTPSVITLSGFVSDLIVPEFTTLFGESRAASAWQRITQILNERNTVSVVTSLFTYENMLITDVTTQVNKDTGRSLNFTMTMQEILVANTATAKLPNRKGIAEDKAANNETGISQSNEPSPSVALQIINGVSGYFGGANASA